MCIRHDKTIVAPAPRSIRRPPGPRIGHEEGTQCDESTVDPCPPPGPEYELYDYETDPLDRDDLAESHPEVVERLGVELDDWLPRALEQRVQEASTADMTPEQVARLRSLGYIQ